jgi:polysaccharide biosynthesis transport protein
MGNTVIQPQSASMLDALRGIWRRKLLLSSTLALGILAGAAILTIIKPAFQAEAQILIESLATPYDRTSAATDTRIEALSDRVVTTQVSVLKSQDLAARVVEQLKLKDRKEFNPQLSSRSSLKSILIATGFADDPMLMSPEQSAVKQILDHVTIYPIPESNVVGVKYQSQDGKMAAAIANTIAEMYVNSTRETEVGSTTRAREWLSQQITDLRGKVSQSEAAVEKYRSEAGLLKGGTTSTLNEQQITELNTQISVAEAGSTEAAARANEIKSLLASKGSVDASSDVLGSPVIQSLREQQVTAARKISELSATYLSNHPKMIAARQEKQSIDMQVRREALKVVDSLAGQAKIAAARAQSLRASLEKMKARAAASNLDDVKLKELERNALADRTLLETMLARYADASARQNASLSPGFARIIQRASEQTVPYFPKSGPIMLLTSLVGLGFGLGLAFLLEVMRSASRVVHPPGDEFRNQRTRSAQTATSTYAPATVSPAAVPPTTIGFGNEHEHAPFSQPAPEQTNLDVVIGQMPTASSVAEAQSLVEVAANDPQSELAQACEVLFQSNKSLIESKSLKGIAFMTIGGSSIDAGLASIAVARCFASHKLKTILVDAAHSSIETLMGLQQGPGLSDLVLGEADFTKVICRDPASAAHAIRFGTKSAAEAQSAIAEKFASIMSALSSIYDVVLINASEASQTTPSVAQYSQAAVMIAPSSRQSDAVSAAEFLKPFGVDRTVFIRLQDSGQVFAKTA